MTYKEAKEYMENLRIDLYDEIHEGIAKQVREKCIEALGKHIPKKPKETRFGVECSTCGSVVRIGSLCARFDYCPWCANAIDWRDEE